MIRSLQLENFKAFGERAQIPFAPITLIFGENSSGKSSILQSLNLLKQTRESREAGALLLPRTDQGISDLGSFQDILFDHTLENSLSIRIEFEGDRRGDPFFRSATRYWRDVRSFGSVAVEVSFERPSLEEEVQLRQIELFLGGNEFLARFRPFKASRSLSRELLLNYPRDSRQVYSGRPKLSVARCEEISESRSLWEPFFYRLKEDASSIVEGLRHELENDLVRPPLFADNEEDEHQLKITYRNSIQDAIGFYSSDFDLSAFISRMRSQQLRTIIGLDGFIPVATPRVSQNFSPELSIRPNRGIRSPGLDMSRVAGILGSSLDRLLHVLFPLGPFRRPPERWYIFTGTSPEDVGYRGELLPDLLFRNPRLIKEANEWLTLLDIGYQLRVQSLGPGVKDLFEVRLVDTRRKQPVEVGLPDVGFGISQILPLLVQSLSSENKIISIEQPEVHIHPRLQADLGDLLAATIKEPRRNQFIIETHSEHLVLRLQKLVRDKKLSPQEVSIVYVTRGPSGAKVERLRLDEDGDFIDDWPGGFFPERLRELR